MRLAIDIAFATAVSAAVMYAGWHWYGPFGLVFGAPTVFENGFVSATGAWPNAETTMLGSLGEAVSSAKTCV